MERRILIENVSSSSKEGKRPLDQELADEGEIRGLIGWELLFFNQQQIWVSLLTFRDF
jgi:hypothetical protein